MSLTWLRDYFKESNASDKRTLTYVIEYECDSQIDYVNHCRRAPLAGSFIRFDSIGVFWIDGTSISRLGIAKPQGKLEFSHEYQLRFPTVEDGDKEKLPPWFYPPEVSYSSSSEEIVLQRVYKAQNDLSSQSWGGITMQLPGTGEFTPAMLTNTAGIPIEVSGTVGLTNITLNYNTQVFDLNTTWGYKSAVNAYPVRLCDIEYKKHYLMIDSISASQQIDYNDDDSEKWRYWKVSVSLIANPRSWDKLFLNVGTHVKTRDGIANLWCWGNGRYFGTYQSYIQSVFNDGEKVSEPMFLNADGTGVSAFSRDGKQLGVYLAACPYYPADFSFLDLPETTGWRG